VVGVGSAAYEAIGAAAAGIRFGVGTYVTYLALTGSGASRVAGVAGGPGESDCGAPLSGYSPCCASSARASWARDRMPSLR
jgi:hypothetical protein